MSNHKIIRIGEHHVELPAMPKDKRKIYLVDEKPNNAYWRRVPFSDHFYKFIPESKVKAGDQFTMVNQQDTIWDDGVLISLSREDTESLYEEVYRDMWCRVHGLWMKNNEQIIWIAPGYYFTLQWGAMKDIREEAANDRQYGKFRWIQNDIMILWNMVKFSPDIAGLLLPKCKKSGITQIFSTDFLNDALTNRGMELAAASKEFDHIKDVFMAYFFNAFDKLPLILQADVAKRNLSEIIFGKEIKRAGSKLGKGQVSDGERTYLGTRVNANKTKTNCLDGPVVKRGFLDEIPKWWEGSKVSPGDTLTKSVEAVKLNQKINGAIAVPSYMPEFDDRGFVEFANFCKKSFLSTKNMETGRTETACIVLPIAADMSNEECFDIHGRCDRKKAKALVEAENASKSTASDKQAHHRQYPLTLAHFFDAGGRGTTFDNIRLGYQWQAIDDELRTGVPPYKYFTLEWTNEDWETKKRGERPRGKFCPAKIVYHEHADVMAKSTHTDKLPVPFLQFDDLQPELLNQVLRWNKGQGYKHEDDDCYCPIPDLPRGVFGFDPVDYVLKKLVSEGSTNAGVGGYLFDQAMETKHGHPYTNIPLIDYYFRDEDPDVDYENLVKLIILTGWYVIVESNKKWVLNSLFKDKLHHFCIIKNEDGTLAPYEPGNEIKPISATQESINDYCRILNRWMAPVRYDGDIDYIKYIKRLTALTQFMSFDPTDTKPFDVAVCYGWWRLGMDALAEYIIRKRDEGKDYDPEAMKAAFAHFGMKPDELKPKMIA